MTRPRRHRSFALFVLAACAVHVALVVLARPGFSSSDDEVYARLAHDMARGTFELIPEHRGNRLGLIAPTAAAYLAFGVGRWTTVLWPLLHSVAGIIVVAVVARRMAGDRAGVLAALVFATLSQVVNASTFLLPDGPVGVQMFAAAACLWTARASRGRRAAAWGAAAAGLIAVGVTIKLTTLWLAPFFAALFVADVARRRHRAAWTAFVATGAVTAAVFFAAYAATTGDALYRLHAIAAQHNDTHWAFADASTADLVRRLSYAPALMILRKLPGLALLMALASAVALHALRRPRDSRLLFWAAYAVVVIGGFWVGTTSFARMAPLPLLPRMLAPAAAPLALLAACALTSGRMRGRALAPGAIIVGAGAAVALADGRLLVACVYVAGGGALLVALRGGGWTRRAALVAVLALPAAMSLYSAIRGGLGESAAMRAERALVTSLPRLVPEGGVVLTDRRSARTIRFYRGYRDREPTVVAWDRAVPSSGAPAYVYWHAARVAWRGGRMAPPAWLAQRAERGRAVWESGPQRLLWLRR